MLANPVISKKIAGSRFNALKYAADRILPPTICWAFAQRVTNQGQYACMPSQAGACNLQTGGVMM